MGSPKKSTDSPNQIMSQPYKLNSSHDPKPLIAISKAKYDLNTPLKISSLLNPIYVPKSTSTSNTQTTSVVKQISNTTQKSETSSEPVVAPNDVTTASSISPIKTISTTTTSNKDKTSPETNIVKETIKPLTSAIISNKIENTIKNTEVKSTSKLVTPQLLTFDGPSTSNGGRLDQHTRRRDLINQLERSIAKGDEHAAAEAAVKLAQLRLSCSVLSFSSQIVADASTSQSTATPQINVSKPVNEVLSDKVEEAIQTSSQTIKELVKEERKLSPEKNVAQNIKQQFGKVKPTLAKMENMDIETPLIPNNPIVSKIEPMNKPNCVTKDATAQNSQPSEASTSKGVIKKEDDDIPILVWVEDKEATRGPVQLHVRRNAVLGDLRGQAEKSLGLAARMQRWIVGKTLCSNDNTSLVTLAGAELSTPFYLCLVESDTKDTPKHQAELKLNDDVGNVYNELVKLEKQPLVSNTEVFECGVCIEACPPGRGVVLRECVHSFCKECLSDTVRHSEEAAVSCPAMGCRGVLQEREIRGLVTPEEYERWLARGLAAAESGTRHAFHCRTRDCTGWALCEPGVRRFPCPVCQRTNCVPCQAIHEEESCEQHRTKLQSAGSKADASQPDEGTRALLDSLISRGEALECPECSAVITKKWGCDWVKCSACKTEICWVTRGRRWGPGGRGDTSAGCRCGVDGKRCHPSCGYCH